MSKIVYNNDHDKNVDEEIIKILNPQNPGSFFLFAGAGSGKTRTLVTVLDNFKEKYGKDFKLHNKKIAIITYTNAAAEEIVHRLAYSPIFLVSTIHSFAWELIKNYPVDIKKWLKDNLEIEIQKLKLEQDRSKNLGNKTSIGRAKKIESKKGRIENLEGIKKFVYNPNGDNITKDSLNHSEVISIAAFFISTKELFKKIVITKFPIILIDESQDTKKELIEALFELQSSNKDRFSLGLFGDTMQRIYSDGKENLGQSLPEDWHKPSKKMNHRSKSRIIALINKIREKVDDQEQWARLENTGGYVRFFSVSRTKDKFETEQIICEKMKEITSDENWSSETKDVMSLILEHHMAAKRLGFSTLFENLYKIESMKTSLLDGSSSAINLFSKIIHPLYEASQKNNKFEIANIVKKHSSLLNNKTLQEEADKIALLKSANNKVSEILDLWNDAKQPKLIEILEIVHKTKLFTIPTTLNIVLSTKVADKAEEIQVEDGGDEDLILWKSALEAPFTEIIQYSKYINGETNFGTHQGVKGLEFDRVMVVVDDTEARGFMFSYDKLFDIKPMTPADLQNVQEGKETGIERTLRLFYVACSRARESLAIVAYSNEPSLLKEKVIEFGWFTEDQVEVIL